MVVPHGSGASRAVEVSLSVVKALIGFGSVLGLVLVVLGGRGAHAQHLRITRSRALERENRLLSDEIQRMRSRLADLQDTLHVFSQRDEEVRLLAGLAPLDSEWASGRPASAAHRARGRNATRSPRSAPKDSRRSPSGRTWTG